MSRLRNTTSSKMNARISTTAINTGSSAAPGGSVVAPISRLSRWLRLPELNAAHSTATSVNPAWATACLRPGTALAAGRSRAAVDPGDVAEVAYAQVGDGDSGTGRLDDSG
jgi:hypothetical protein